MLGHGFSGGVPPSAHWEAGAGVWVAPPLPITQQWHTHRFLGRPCFLQQHSQLESSSLICTTSCGPLPETTLLTPHFSTQTPPALVGSRLRQGHPGLIPEEALPWAALMTPNTSWMEEAFARGLGEPDQMGAPTSVLEDRTSCGDMGNNGLPACACHSGMPCFYGIMAFYKLSWQWSSLFLSLQAFHSQQLSPLRGSTPYFPAPNTPIPPEQETQLRLGCMGLQYRSHIQFLLCLAFHSPLQCSPLIPKSSFSVSADFPTMRGFS